jgi:ribosomal protein S18 acetylase RimI-like enzyme
MNNVTLSTPKKQHSISIEVAKKSKKQEPKVFPSLMLVDKEAFESCGQSNTKFIMKEFWNSPNNKILLARKSDTKSIVGYAIFSVCELKDPRLGNKRNNSVYLLRIGVRINSQRQGIGRKLLSYLLSTYPEHALSLDVSTDNMTAVAFYRRMGLKIQRLYLEGSDGTEFATFETPIDKKGMKIQIDDPEMASRQIQPYFDDV